MASLREGRMASARDCISASGASRSGTMMGRMPAACAARMPLNESSITKHSAGGLSSFRAASRKMSCN